MSKKKDRESREKREQQLLEVEVRFSQTLLGYLQGFASYYRQDPPTDQALEMYRLGLRHLTPQQLRAAYEESIRKCKFFPTVAEMLECLKEWNDRQPAAGTARALSDDAYIPTKKEAAEFKEFMNKNFGKKKFSFPPAKAGTATREPGDE